MCPRSTRETDGIAAKLSRCSAAAKHATKTGSVSTPPSSSASASTSSAQTSLLEWHCSLGCACVPRRPQLLVVGIAVSGGEPRGLDSRTSTLSSLHSAQATCLHFHWALGSQTPLNQDLLQKGEIYRQAMPCGVLLWSTWTTCCKAACVGRPMWQTADSRAFHARLVEISGVLQQPMDHLGLQCLHLLLAQTCRIPPSSLTACSALDRSVTGAVVSRDWDRAHSGGCFPEKQLGRQSGGLPQCKSGAGDAPRCLSLCTPCSWLGYCSTLLEGQSGTWRLGGVGIPKMEYLQW